MPEITYRNELKHVISPADKAAISASLRAVTTPDSHAGLDGRYTIRSLYFDNAADQALREKLDGVNDASVSFMTQKMKVEFAEGADEKTVMQAVVKACKKVEDDCEIYL